MRLSTLYISLAVMSATAGLRAQWVTYSNQTNNRVSAAASLVTGDQQEKDYAWGDLDKDGDIDLVIVRKQPFTTGGHFPNVLLMNENGVLTDRSATLTTSTVAGSSGFLDATNDRDVVIADINGDGWDDVITATTLTAGMPTYIRANRVYINQGEQNGVWQGLLYDDALRIDDTPYNGEHRFCSVAAGDVDGDGDVDLYFGDYQQGGTRSIDVNDRLLINDGTGYFTDESSTRMTVTMLESSFGMKVAIHDMNNDGKLDILKDDALNAPQAVSISYNNTATEGVFGDYTLPYGNQPYHFNLGDLNNDGWTDFIVSDDGQDQYVLNQGATGSQPAQFSNPIAFSYSGGGNDDGFGGNNIIADLDNDGWADAIVADVDVDISGCNRRCHIFRNLGNAPNVTLQEQIVNGQVVGGITPAALQGTFDVAIFDIDGDGWKDLVVGRCTGTEVYMCVPPVGLTFAFVGGLPSMIAPGVAQQVTVDATGIGGVTPVAGTGELFYSINNAPFQSIAMSDSGPGQFQATLPAMPNCADGIRFYVSAQGSNGSVYNDPPAAPSGYYSAVAAVSLDTIYSNNFEQNDTGWTVVNTNLTTGAWERATPNGTTQGAEIAAPFDDAEAGAATFCMVTENGLPGGSVGTADVDGGPTDLISPQLDFGGTDGFISYQRWFYSSGADVLEVAVSGDGTNWVTVEVVDGDNNEWTLNQFRVGAFITPTSTVQVRFRTADVSPGSIVEAALDVFKAETFNCDWCQPTFPLTTIGTGTLSMCGDQLSATTPSTTLKVENVPPSAYSLLLFDAFAVPVTSPWNSGELISAGPGTIGPLFANASGEISIPLNIGGLLPPGWAIYLQGLYTDASLPGQVGITNALRVEWY
ncbi:MAG: FG-GAP-like repeat-containing protein [Planctomycetota bacterium]